LFSGDLAAPVRRAPCQIAAPSPFAGSDVGEKRPSRGNIMRSRRSARDEQRMNAGGEPAAVGAAQIKIVKGNAGGGAPFRIQLFGQVLRKRRFSAALRARETENDRPPR